MTEPSPWEGCLETKPFFKKTHPFSSRWVQLRPQEPLYLPHWHLMFSYDACEIQSPLPAECVFYTLRDPQVTCLLIRLQMFIETLPSWLCL